MNKYQKIFIILSAISLILGIFPISQVTAAGEMRRALVDTRTNEVINVILYEDGANWRPPEGCALLDAEISQLADIGDKWDGTQLIKVEKQPEVSLPAGADIAEYYSVFDQTIEAGDVVSVSKNPSLIVEKSIQPYDQKLMGVISTNPALIINERAKIDSKENLKPVALAGRTPVKVSLKGGSIKPGDLLTSSNIPGVAMKATRLGQVIGKALEGFTSNDPNEIGKIMVFLNVGWYGNDLNIGEGNGQLINLSPEELSQSLVQLGLVINEYGTLEVKNLKAEVVETQRLKVLEKIQLRDQATGEIYCTWIENGEWIKVQGECDSATSTEPEITIDSQQSAPETTTTTTSTTTAATTTTATTTSTTTTPTATTTATTTEPTCQPSEEICDGIDNDCDGQIDEELTKQCGSSNVGVCQFGIKTCSAGLWGECIGVVEPTEEICYDNIDNNCDGQIDEGCQTQEATSTATSTD